MGRFGKESKRESSYKGQGIWQQGFNWDNGTEMEESSEWEWCRELGDQMEATGKTRKNNKVMLLTETKETVGKRFWNKSWIFHFNTYWILGLGNQTSLLWGVKSKEEYASRLRGGLRYNVLEKQEKQEGVLEFSDWEVTGESLFLKCINERENDYIPQILILHQVERLRDCFLYFFLSYNDPALLV